MPTLEYSEWLDTITLLLTVSGLILGFIYTQLIQSDTTRPAVVAFFQQGHVRSFYQSGLVWLLGGLNYFYGNKESSRAFNASLLLAYLYPFLFFILSYSYFGGTSQFSDVALLSVDEYSRIWLFPALLLLLVMLFFVVRFMLNNGDAIDAWFGHQLNSINLSKSFLVHVISMIVGLMVAVMLLIQRDDGLWVTLVGFGLGYSCVALSFFVASAGSSAFSIVGIALFLGIYADFFSTEDVGFSAFVTAIAFAIIFFGAVVFAGAGVWAGVFSVATTTFFFSVQKDKNISLMWVLFYFALPLVNGLLDWLSWWVSRYFIERAAQGRQVWVIVLDIVGDFFAAVAFMLALCLLLPAVAELLDRLYAGDVDAKTGTVAMTHWRDYAVLARDEPWSRGIMVTLMLVTTLIPTLLHIFWGMVAFFIHSFRGKELASYLELTPQGHNWRYAVASLWIFGYGLLSGLAMWVLYELFQHFAQLPIAHWLYNFTGYFYDLP